MPTINAGFSRSGGEPDEDALVRYGPTIYVRIGFDAEYQLGNATQPNLPSNQLPALVDTGALESCSDSTLAMGLSLPVVDRRRVAGAHGAGEVNYHLAQIYIPDLDFTISGLFAGVHLTAGGQRHSALIGRTFLRHFTMAYEGRTGIVTISND